MCVCGDQAGERYIKAKCVIISNSNQVLAIGKKWNQICTKSSLQAPHTIVYIAIESSSR